MEGGRVRKFRPDYLDPVALPAGRIAALADDGRYLWVGTGAGLARYAFDGTSFTRIAMPGVEGRVEIKALSVTNAGLVIGTDQGAFLHDGKSVVALSFPETDPDERIAVNGIASRSNRTVLATSRGLFAFENATRLRRHSSPFDRQPVRHINFAPDGALWGITEDSLFGEVRQATGGWSVLPQATTPGIPQDTLTTFAFDPKGRMWLASRNDLARSSNPAKGFTPCRRAINGTDPDGDMGVIHLSFGLGPYVFAGTSGTGATHAPLTNDVSIIPQGFAQFSGLSGATIWNATKFPDGRLLVATSEGLFKEAGPAKGAFQSVAPTALGERLIYSTLIDGNRILAGTDRGLFLVSPEGHARQIELALGDAARSVHPVYIIRRQGSALLVGTAGGLFVVDAATLRVRRFFRTNPDYKAIGTPPVTDVPGARIWSLDVRGDTVLAAADTHVLILDLAEGRVIATTEAAGKAGTFVGGRINVALHEDDRRILIGTSSGLFRTDPGFAAFEAVKQINSVTIDAVNVLARGSDGQVWLGAAGNGLFHKKPDETTWRHLGEGDGLITNSVGQLGLSFAGDGGAILTSGSGASIISPGLARAGMVRTSLDAIVFEDLSGTMLTRDRPRLSVPPGARDLKLQFAIPALLEHGEYIVEYRLGLDGEETDIVRMPLGEDLNLFRPQPGLYRLSGKIISASGDLSQPFVFEIDVRPFWWERREAYFAFCALLVLLGILVFKAYDRARRRRVELITSERRRIAQSLHDSTLQDMFGALLLSRSLAMADAASQNREKGKQIERLLTSATESLRSSIAINGDRQEVHDLSAAIRDLEPPAALAHPVELRIAEEGRRWALGKHRAYCALQIVVEAVNNSVKHAGSQEVQISLHWTLTALVITICDDGSGFNPAEAANGTGFGVAGMQNMATAAKFRLGLESAPGSGTKVVLKVPRLVL